MRNRLACAVLLALILCCLQLGMPRPVMACYCIPPATVQEGLLQSDAVFRGTLTRITLPQPNPVNSTYTPAVAEFQVASVWKGAVGPHVKLTFSPSQASCGYDFQSGVDYLVYARSYVDDLRFSVFSADYHLPIGERKLTTGICMRTQLLSNAQQDLAALGQGISPAQPGLIQMVLDNLLAVVAGLFALVIAVILYLIRRKRRRTFRLKP